jgi:preprotein translocase subunit SecA
MLKKLFGSQNDRLIKKINGRVSFINDLEAKYKAMSDQDLQSQTSHFRQLVDNGAPLDSLLNDAFAVVRETSRRTLNMRHFDVQLVGGIALFEGNIAEMKTGEGKTLTATAPMYLHALSGKGAHLVTVNDYLARRDAEWMGQIYKGLGLSTGTILHGISDKDRQAAYASDITYGTNNEFGFDYLRDNMKTQSEHRVQKKPNFAIVDEVDSILIDEARTPLIISGPTETNTEIYYEVNTAIPGLHKDVDYIIDEKSHSSTLTEDGINKLEKRLRIKNLYDPSSIDYLHHIQQSLKAHVLFKKDVDYVIRDGKIVIVDEHTGRLMPGRRYSDGLHGALEAKEHLRVETENQTLATITFQNLFRMYDVLAGMTGTADTEAVEFKKIYDLDVISVPTNVELTRLDQEDIIYRTAVEKFNVIADEIAVRQKKDQPVLVGTVSVERSELLSSLLKKRNIPHEVLNAKNHAREALIIENAGTIGHVTIATNMAGRGTDIVLGPGVREAGGLCVIGTERHESRRIDNQLRGRAGRQGDPGESLFYLSLEDDLMRIFASDRLSSLMQKMGMTEGESIVSPMVTKAIERAQRRVEEQNFSSRKHLLEYDDVMNQQRQVIYARRLQVLENEVDIDFLEETVARVAHRFILKHSPDETNGSKWDLPSTAKELTAEFSKPINLDSLDPEFCTVEQLADEVSSQVMKLYNDIRDMVTADTMRQVEAYIYLQIIDQAWKDHLLQMDYLKDAVSLRGYAQRDPLQEYKKEAYRLFEETMLRIEEETTLALVRMPPPELENQQQANAHEPDQSAMQFSHPQAKSALPGSADGPQGSANGSQKNKKSADGMIYYGSRDKQGQGTSEPAAPVAQTVRRNEAKVGRNDNCPCGSGKKYKKCHGRAGALENEETEQASR